MKTPRRKVQALPQPSEATPVPRPMGMRRWSWVDTRLQLHRVEQLLVSMASHTAIVNEMREQYGCGRKRADRLIARVRASWAAQDQGNREAWRAQQVRSVSSTIARLKSRIAAVEVRVNPDTGQAEFTGKVPAALYQVQARYEELLMELTGARAPEQVNVNHSGAVTVNATLQAVALNLSPEEYDEMLATYQETERLAEMARTSITVMPNGKVQ